MAKPFARVDVSESLFMIATLPVPKVKNQETGEVATDRATGAAMYIVNLLETSGGQAQVLKITVAEPGLPEGLAPGMTVRPVKLIASPWANVFGDQVNSGLSYRAEGLELVK
ncbi:SCO3933 family regulatory protein [Wenjunlia tyrosinilytica]|uniref:Regulatory protein n=1 Tax=Wenjunlia tyrosinilytica TaxID=1544741 RepID=A0A918DVT2_9ACTN|nr:hypothetical protein [Wenjunlia tyrosinilytica]GGO86498.1 hypothetical protein GCM10012280_22770 [Wenjunlia tyrosinilytica]